MGIYFWWPLFSPVQWIKGWSEWDEEQGAAKMLEGTVMLCLSQAPSSPSQTFTEWLPCTKLHAKPFMYITSLKGPHPLSCYYYYPHLPMRKLRLRKSPTLTQPGSGGACSLAVFRTSISNHGLQLPPQTGLWVGIQGAPVVLEASWYDCPLGVWTLSQIGWFQFCLCLLWVV